MSKRQLQKQERKSRTTPEELRILAAHKHEHNHQHQLTISPFPSATEMEKIHSLDPSILSRMMDMAESQIKADIENSKEKIILEKEEQKIRKTEVEGDIQHKARGQKYGLTALIFLGFVTLGLVYFQAYKTAAAFATITIIGGTTAFTGLGKNENKKNKKNSPTTTA